MSAAVKAGKRAPSFHTDEFVEIVVEPEDLESAGWRYVGKGDEGPTEQTVLDVVMAWHDLNHPDPWRWCSHEPCDTLRGREEG